MSRVLPILFNTDMVQAILDGRKTVTRRVIKNQGYIADNRQPYRKGDVLYVRETWTTHYVPDEEGKPKLEYCYKADGIDIKGECLPGENNRWYPSIHMPKEVARIWLKVTDVRVERLQDMMPIDAYKEGCRKGLYGDMTVFYKIWESTIKKSEQHLYGWRADPWVWVIEFEQCEKPKEL